LGKRQTPGSFCTSQERRNALSSSRWQLAGSQKKKPERDEMLNISGRRSATLSQELITQKQKGSRTKVSFEAALIHLRTLIRDHFAHRLAISIPVHSRSYSCTSHNAKAALRGYRCAICIWQRVKRSRKTAIKINERRSAETLNSSDTPPIPPHSTPEDTPRKLYYQMKGIITPVKYVPDSKTQTLSLSLSSVPPAPPRASIKPRLISMASLSL
ncbi:Cortactin-binding protein 2, partial [Clarias magur]